MKKIIICMLLVMVNSVFAVDKAFTLLSTAFHVNDAIPQMYTCQGVDVSPPLIWMDPPVGVRSYALVVSDPDAIASIGHVVIHALVYNINSDATGIPTNFQGHFFGLNSYNNAKYQGPCPPEGMHHYIFSLYALDRSSLHISQDPTMEQFTNAMQGHIIDVADMTVTYTRK